MSFILMKKKYLLKSLACILGTISMSIYISFFAIYSSESIITDNYNVRAQNKITSTLGNSETAFLACAGSLYLKKAYPLFFPV